MKAFAAHLKLPIVLMALSVFATGCILGDPPGVFEDTPCECPSTERITLNTDWFGDDRAAGSLQSFGSGPEGGETPLVALDFEGFASLDDAETALGDLTEHFKKSDLPPLGYSSSNTGLLQTDDFRITVWTPFMDGENDLLLIQVMVELFADDSEAPKLLAPLVEALGTLS